MSVSSDFWSSHEPRGSSAMRLAQTFRRSRSATAAYNTESSWPEWQRRKTTGGGSSSEPMTTPPSSSLSSSRRTSLAGLSLRLMRSRSSKAFENVEEEESDPIPFRHKLGDIFFSMPNEIQVNVISFMEPHDLLSIRLVSRAFFDLLRINASVVTRSVLSPRSSESNSTSESAGGSSGFHDDLADDPLYLQTLYPPPDPIRDLDYLVQLLHRQAVVEKMVMTLVNFIQIKIYQIRTPSRQAQFEPNRRRMLQEFKAPLFIIYHHLEMLRRNILSHHEFHLDIRRKRSSNSDLLGLSHAEDNTSSSSSCLSCERLQLKTINKYPPDQLLPAYQLFKVMVSALRRKLRPPTYAGTIERKLRRWDREPPTDDDVAQVLLLGGMREVQHIMSIPKYVHRLAALRSFQDSLNTTTTVTSAPRKEISPPKTRTPAMKALDTPDASSVRRVGISRQPIMPLLAIWVPPVRARIIKGKLVESEEDIPNAFAYIAGVIAGDSNSIGEEEAEEAPVHTIDFAQRAAVADELINDEDEVEGEVIAANATNTSGFGIERGLVDEEEEEEEDAERELQDGPGPSSLSISATSSPPTSPMRPFLDTSAWYMVNQ